MVLQFNILSISIRAKHCTHETLGQIWIRVWLDWTVGLMSASEFRGGRTGRAGTLAESLIEKDGEFGEANTQVARGKFCHSPEKNFGLFPGRVGVATVIESDDETNCSEDRRTACGQCMISSDDSITLRISYRDRVP